MERRLHSQRKSFRRQLKHKLSESAHTGNFYPQQGWPLTGLVD